MAKEANHGVAIPIEDGMLKRGLLVCVPLLKPHYDKNKIDEIAKEKTHAVLRLPPYHCELNSIEMVWTQLKHYIKMNNTTFKVKDISELVAQSYNKITAHNWQNYIEHVKNVEKDMGTVDNLQDDIEQFIIHVTYSSSSKEESDNFLNNRK